MDGITLLAQAHAAGLDVTVNGDKLEITGPKSAGDIAQRLIANKATVMMALAIEATDWETRVETIDGVEYDVTTDADDPAPGWHEAIEPTAAEVVDIPKPRRRRAVKQAAELFDQGALSAQAAPTHKDSKQ